jgi:vesicle coat complex subunit
MREIRDDLQDRANVVEQQISAENAQFEQLILQLKAEQDSRVEHLRDRGLPDLNAELKQLTMDPWRAPERVGQTDIANEPA